jgi:hypothetical protein
VRESAVSAKRFCFMFGAKPAQSETPVRAAAKRRSPGRGVVGSKTRSYLEVRSSCRCELMKDRRQNERQQKEIRDDQPKVRYAF